MERNTKILIGVAAAGVVGYMIVKRKIAKNKNKAEDEKYLKQMEEEIKNGIFSSQKADVSTDHVETSSTPSRNIKLDNSIFSNCVCIMAPCNCGGGGSELGAVKKTDPNWLKDINKLDLLSGGAHI